jgi:hypothetical protein
MSDQSLGHFYENFRKLWLLEVEDESLKRHSLSAMRECGTPLGYLTKRLVYFSLSAISRL